MGWVAPALGIASTLFGASQQKKAANAQVDASKQALALQQQMWQMQQQNLQPFMQYGTGAGGLGGLGALAAGDYSGFMNSPDYQVGLDAQQRNLASKQSAKLDLFGGGASVDRDRAAQEYALSKFGDYRNSLMWGANLGQNAAAGVGQAGQAYANNAGNLYGQMADARGTGYGANAGALYGLAGLAQQYWPSASTPMYSSVYGGSAGTVGGLK